MAKQQLHKDAEASWGWDLAAGVGLLLLLLGLAAIYWPLALVVAGAAGLLLGVLGARAQAWRDAGGKRKPEEDGW